MTSDRRAPLALRVSGELIVIVIGVLIALWLDNVNESRRESVQETAYLGGILIDLRGDSLDLADRQATALRSIEVADRLLELGRDKTSTAAPDSLAAWFLRAAFVDNFQVLDHTFREILGAGGLILIRDEKLRRQVSDYYRSIDSAEFFTEYYKGEETDYWNLLAERLDADDFEGITRAEEGPGRLIPDRLLGKLRTDDEIVNAILMNRHWTRLRLEITGRRLAGNAALVAALQDQLARQSER